MVFEAYFKLTVINANQVKMIPPRPLHRTAVELPVQIEYSGFGGPFHATGARFRRSETKRRGNWRWTVDG